LADKQKRNDVEKAKAAATAAADISAPTLSSDIQPPPYRRISSPHLVVRYPAVELLTSTLRLDQVLKEFLQKLPIFELPSERTEAPMSLSAALTGHEL
jgi:hypothetical protein